MSSTHSGQTKAIATTSKTTHVPAACILEHQKPSLRLAMETCPPSNPTEAASRKPRNPQPLLKKARDFTAVEKAEQQREAHLPSKQEGPLQARECSATWYTGWSGRI